jgi:hypothetical protein
LRQRGISSFLARCTAIGIAAGIVGLGLLDLLKRMIGLGGTIPFFAALVRRGPKPLANKEPDLSCGA